MGKFGKLGLRHEGEVWIPERISSIDNVWWEMSGYQAPTQDNTRWFEELRNTATNNGKRLSWLSKSSTIISPTLEDNEEENKVKALEGLAAFTDIACGKFNSLLLLQGRVYSVGDDRFGISGIQGLNWDKLG